MGISFDMIAVPMRSGRLPSGRVRAKGLDPEFKRVHTKPCNAVRLGCSATLRCPRAARHKTKEN